MINIEIKDIHLGQAIKKRFDETGMTKTEFGRLIGVPQQHVNRIFERETMETKKLIKVCRELEYNFFALFCQFPTNVNAYLAAVALGDGDANNNIGDTTLLAQLEVAKAKIEGLTAHNATLKDQVEQLKSQLADKDAIIQLTRDK